MQLNWLILLFLIFNVTQRSYTAFEPLFGLVRLFGRAVPPPTVRPSIIRSSNSKYVDGVVSSLRKDIDAVDRQAISASRIEDQFDNGINIVTDTVYLVGVRQRALNISKFCGALADRQYRDVQMAVRDGILYRPTVPLTGSVVNISLAVPRAWFRENPRQNNHKELRLLVCYEGETRLVLLPITIHPPELETDGQHFVFTQKSFYDFMTIREIALVLDGSWNNGYLLPRNMKSTIQINTREVKKRPTYSNICNSTQGLDQTCCLWPFSSRVLFGSSDQVNEVTFHRCVGRIPNEVNSFPFLSAENSELLQHGGMSRRFLVRKDKVCRESRFKPITLTVSEPYGIYTKKLNRLDATECSVYY
ncbi:unnamed protein product [Auanema sp. JU1783]|nr:unnamed protein product [Auanema sp. JU1783]